MEIFNNRIKRTTINISIIIFISLLMFIFQPQSNHLFSYDYIYINQGEWWRIISNSFCHTNLPHFLMNCLGLIVITTLFIKTFKESSIWPLFIFSSIFISFCIYFIEAENIRYVGLSGVLHALFAYGVCRDCLRKDRWGYILACALLIKLASEQYFGASQTTRELINASVLVNAHLYGAISGATFTMLNFSKKTLFNNFFK